MHHVKALKRAQGSTFDRKQLCSESSFPLELTRLSRNLPGNTVQLIHKLRFQLLRKE